LRVTAAVPRGFTRTASGFRAWVRVSSHRDAFDELRTKRFTGDATAPEIRAWRTDTRDNLRRQLDAHRQRRAEACGAAGTFRADASQYLEAVRALTTYAERTRDIGLWIDEFGDRPRPAIKPHEIRTVRDRWLTVGPRRVWRKVNGVGQWIDVAGPLSASTVNHRLRALSNLWTVLNGKHAPNPVREVPEAHEPVAVPRAIDYDTIRQVLAAMADRGRPVKGVPRPAHSLAKARARVMAWTGITPKELALVQPDDIHWHDSLIVVPARRKGRGAPGRIVPLGPDATTALQEFDRLGAYGRFRTRGVLRAWHRACQVVLGRRVRLYDLRHSFVTGIVRATKNLTTAQLLAGHQDPRTTQRYALAALLPTLRAGIDSFTQSVTPKEKT
jgi:integrase